MYLCAKLVHSVPNENERERGATAERVWGTVKREREVTAIRYTDSHAAPVEFAPEG